MKYNKKNTRIQQNKYMLEDATSFNDRMLRAKKKYMLGIIWKEGKNF